MYGRRGRSSNVGSRSLPTTTSSSACARLCTSGKSVRARKKKFIEDMVFIIVFSKNAREYKIYARCLNRLRRGVVSAMHLYHYYMTIHLKTSIPSSPLRSPLAFHVLSQPNSLTSASAPMPMTPLLCHYSTTSSISQRERHKVKSPHTRASFTKSKGSFLIL